MSVPITFTQAYAAFGCDTMRISASTGLPEHEVESRIHALRLTKWNAEKPKRDTAAEWQRTKAQLAAIREKSA